MKLNTTKINQTDKYLLTSSRDSLLRLWDLRKLPNENENEENIKKNKNYVNEYNKHKCVEYNIECNFYNNEQYIITGSENSHIYIYDISNSDLYHIIKTQPKCINLIKQIPNTYNIAFTGLEDISIFILNAHKNITKYYERKYLQNNNKNDDSFMDDSDGEKDLDELEETDKSRELCNKLI
jgi:WD40 repeat protein